MKTKEQQAEQYAREKKLDNDIALFSEKKEIFLAGYDAAVNDNTELIGKIRGIVGDALATQSYPNFEMALYQLRNLLKED